MARTDTLGHFLTDVADAIRTKGGTSEEITASDFDTAIENLPSGSMPTPTSFDDLVNKMVALVTLFATDGIELIAESYSTDGTDNITLYTPNADFKYYFICKNTSGKYRCVWTKDPIYIASGNIQCFGASLGRSYSLKLSNPAFPFTVTGGADYYYYSGWISSIDTCKQMLTDSSSTYTYGSTYFSGIDTSGEYVVPYCNTMIAYNNGSTTEYVSSKRLSTNETISVIE